MPFRPTSPPPPQASRSTPRRRNPLGAPAFLLRLRARQAPQRPRWLDWNSLIILGVVAVFVWLATLLSPILAPFLAAAILAYICDPLVDKLEARGVSRSIGTVIAVLVMLVSVVLLLVIVLPLFYKEVAQLTEQLPRFVEHLKGTVLPWVNDKLGTAFTLDPSSFRQFMQDNIADAGGIAKRIFATIGTGGLAVVSVLINLALIPVVLFYLLRDWDRLVTEIDGLVPRRHYDTVRTIVGEVDAVLSEFLRGQLMVMIIMAAFYVIGLWAVGLEFALPVGLITGLLVFVPYLGVGLGLLLGTVAAVMQFGAPTGVALVWLVFGLGQLVESFLVTPKFVGERIGLHPVAVIFALLAFGQAFGFFGVLLALPASAAILVWLRHMVARYRTSDVFRR